MKKITLFFILSISLFFGLSLNVRAYQEEYGATKVRVVYDYEQHFHSYNSWNYEENTYFFKDIKVSGYDPLLDKVSNLREIMEYGSYSNYYYFLTLNNVSTNVLYVNDFELSNEQQVSSYSVKALQIYDDGIYIYYGSSSYDIWLEKSDFSSTHGIDFVLTVRSVVSASRDYNDGYDDGYDDGKTTWGYFKDNEWFTGNQAYNRGVSDGISGNQHGFRDLLFATFNGMSALFAIELLPNISIGAIISVPLVFGIIYFVLGVARSSSKKGGKKE